MNRFARYNTTLRVAKLALWAVLCSVLLAGVATAYILPRTATDAEIADINGLHRGIEYPVSLLSDHLKDRMDGVVVHFSESGAEDKRIAENFNVWPMVPVDACRIDRCGVKSDQSVTHVAMTSVVPRGQITVHIANVEQSTIKLHFDDTLSRYGNDSMHEVLSRTVMDITLTQAQAESVKLKP